MKDKYTILVIPPDNAPTKQFDISTKARRLGIGSLILSVTILAGVVAHDLWQQSYIKKHQADFARAQQMQNLLQEKNNEIDHLNEESAKMTENLNEITSLEGKISSMLKLNGNLPPTNLSRGATPQGFTPSPDMNANASTVASYLNLLKQYYNVATKFEDKLNHTPSIMPIDGPIVITSPFGYRKNPFGGWSSEFHAGVDIACSYGTPVHTTADGTVTFAGWDAVYGWKVQIDHGNGIVTFYGHNSRLLVHAGDTVKKGEVISYSGNSGRSTGAHLHYGAYLNDQLIDPLMFTNATKEQ